MRLLIGWSRIGTNEWVSSQYLSSIKSMNSINSNSFNSYKARTTAKSGLNVRTGPSTSYRRVGSYSYNTEITILQESSGWARTNLGWISINYITRINSNFMSNSQASGYRLGRYKVNTKSGLNVRTGPSTSYRIKKPYKNRTVFDTNEIKGSWAKTPSGWVNLNYCILIYKY